MLVLVFECGHQMPLHHWTPIKRFDRKRWCRKCKAYRKVFITEHNAPLEHLILALLPNTKQRVIDYLCYPRTQKVKGFLEKKVRGAIWGLRRKHEILLRYGKLICY